MADPLTYPAFHAVAGQASRTGQDRYMNAIRVRLAALVVAAVGGALGGAGFAWVALVGFVVALAAEVVILALRPDQVWYEGRAAAESVKTLAWRYAVGGDPFPHGGPDPDPLFRDRMQSVTRDLAHVYAASTSGALVTDAMRALRARPFEERRAAYLGARIDDQRRWYDTKARSADRHHTGFLLTTIALEFGGIVAAALRVAGVVEIDLLGIVAAVVAGVASWAQTRQYGSLARAYAIANRELNSIKEQAERITEADWARFVDEAEEAISREHTLWRASRGVRVTPP